MKKTAQGGRILVVDDDLKIGKMLREVLEDDGYEVSFVASGEEAVSLFPKGDFDLIILDMILPGMNGLQTLKKLKELDRDVRVIVMTGYSVLGMLEDASKVGVMNTLFKPFHMDQIVNAVRESIGGGGLEKKTEFSALIIDDESKVQPQFSEVLTELGFEAVCFRSVEDVHQGEKDREFDLILVNDRTLLKNSVETFKFVQDQMPTSKHVLILGDNSDVGAIIKELKKSFRREG